jgi:hypothetical protein
MVDPGRQRKDEEKHVSSNLEFTQQTPSSSTPLLLNCDCQHPG